MNKPSTGPSPEPQTCFPEIARPPSVLKMNGRPLPVDSPYTSARSPSGHLLPCSPAPPRRYSRDHILSMAGSQTSLYDEPASISHHTPKIESPLQSSSSATVFTHHCNLTSDSDIHLHQLHPNAVAGTPFGSLKVDSSPQLVYTHSGASMMEPHQNALYSMGSASQLSISQKSFNSQSSTGRASYREYRGRARGRTKKVVPAIGLPPSTLERAEPGGFAAPLAIIAPPSADDPNRPGEPTVFSYPCYPMSVSSKLRHYANRNIRPLSGMDHTIEAMAYQYPKTPEVPQGWTACRHPEGALYFMHDESRTFTEVNICDDGICGDIEYFRAYLLSELKIEIETRELSNYLIIEEVELVLEPRKEGQDVCCCYYFVYPPARSVFWLDKWDGEEILNDCPGILSSPHKGLAIEAQYWCVTYVSHLCIARNHWDLFPNSRKVTQELKDEVVKMILHATCDHLTSNTSTCPLSVEELKNHLAVVNQIDPDTTGKSGHCAIVISRIMHSFYRAYFINYYGEDCARLNFDQTVHGWRYHPSLLMKIFAPLLFMVPVNTVRLLHRISADSVVSKGRWETFLTRLNSHLEATSVLSTVLLNASVGLLQTQSQLSTVSAQEFLTYASLVASMASIILGLVFMGKNRLEERREPSEVVKFLDGLRHEKHGLEALAIIYSLPHALLIWGILLFFAAFAVQWCQQGKTVFRACAGAFVLAGIFLVVWSIWAARDASHSWWFPLDLYQPRQEGSEEEENEDNISFGIPRLGFFHRFMTSSQPPHIIEPTSEPGLM